MLGLSQKIRKIHWKSRTLKIGMDWLRKWEGLKEKDWHSKLEGLSQNREGSTQKKEKEWVKTRKVQLKKEKDWNNEWEGLSQNREGPTQKNEKDWIKTREVQLKKTKANEKQKTRRTWSEDGRRTHKSEIGWVETREVWFKNTAGLNFYIDKGIFPNGHKQAVITTIYKKDRPISIST